MNLKAWYLGKLVTVHQFLTADIGSAMAIISDDNGFLMRVNINEIMLQVDAPRPELPTAAEVPQSNPVGDMIKMEDLFRHI